MKHLIIPGLLLVLITACAPTPVPTGPNDPQHESTRPQSEPTPRPTAPNESAAMTANTITATTRNNPLGNPTLNGQLDLRNASTLDIPLNGTPLWVVSAPFQDGVLVAAVLDDGNVQAFTITPKTFEPFDIAPAQLPPGMPPLLVVSGNTAYLLAPPTDSSSLTNPVLLGEKIAYIASNGDLVIGDKRLPVNALPDSRILVDEANRLLILTEPTRRYTHGVLGDDIEAASITLIETEPETRVLRTIPIGVPDVIEGIAPIWADIDGNGIRDIIVTLSNDTAGARLVAFNEDGSLLAESDPIGRGFRWRHQLAVFAADDTLLLAAVRTPHIGGIVEFFALKNGKLEVVREQPGFSTHSIGSRNLDSALFADWNADGRMELLAPDQSHTSLGIISTGGASPVLLPLGSVMTSNLSAAPLSDGTLILAAGWQGALRIWLP